ncbi:3'-5' exonuclease [Streptomyces sp. NPDC048659]|uniref:3'-5' exonuclease n=1 Tax=Streptomyces sp. NPDC048659 TaxID=3155489 RepID=UPI0034329EAA
MALTDPDLLAATFVGIDFETLNPAGRRPEPIEIAAVAGKLTATGSWQEDGRFERFIRPPVDVPFTSFDTAQTGITAAMIQQADGAAVTLAALEELFAHPPYVLFAHNAPYEAGLIYDQEAACPVLARLPMLDTVRLARTVYPDLPRHRLDDVLSHLGMPPPAGRHRAMPDVLATCAVFSRMVTDGARAGRWSTLTDLHRVAAIEPKALRDDARAAAPQQDSLF